LIFLKNQLPINFTTIFFTNAKYLIINNKNLVILYL